MLTTLTAIKARLEITTAADDAMITGFAEWMSAMAESRCSRRFARTEGDAYEFSAERTEIVVPRYPIEQVISLQLRENARAAWRSQSAAFEVVNESGIVSMVGGALGTRLQRARVVYTGGYVLPGTTAEDGQTALPDDLENAVIEQTAYWYGARHALRLPSTGAALAAAREKPSGLVLLPQVEETLSRYVRVLV